MRNFDTIIIGGGLGGLVAGATLAKKGNKVVLLEKHYIPGGCATTFKRKEFVMEVGLHEMDGLCEHDAKLDIFKFLEIDKHIDFIQVPELFRLKTTKTDFVHPHGITETMEALIDRFPKETEAITKFIALLEGVLSEIAAFPTDKWKQNLSKPFVPVLFPNIFKASRKTVGEWLDYLFTDEELKIILQANLVYYHDDPYTMSMIYFATAQAGYIKGGGHFIKGGSQKLSNYLVEVIESNGGQVLLGKSVTEIITDNGICKGVSYVDSFNSSKKITLYGQSVIANAAIPLVKKLLPRGESDKLGKKVDKLKTACSLLSIYIGFKKEIKDIGNKHYSTFITGKNVNSIKDIHANCHGEWKDKNFVFVDYSQIDAGLAPKGKSFGAICSADYYIDWEHLSAEEYQAKKEEVAHTLFDRLEEHIPGIKAEIDYYEVGTAKTIQRFTSNPEGTPYGFAQTPEQAGMGRTPFTSPIKNLYFAGAWTFPGGGFTGAIISGFLCALKVDKKVKVKQSDLSLIDSGNTLELLRKIEIAKNTLELVYSRPKDFDYKVGQYAILELLNPKYSEIDIPHRALSLVSHPSENVLRFAMRYSDSSYKQSVKALEIGDKSRVFGPMGQFSVAPTSKGIVFLVAGIGITPILPILKELKITSPQKTIYLIYSNRFEDAAAYHLQLLENNNPNFNYVPVITSQEKRIDKALLKATIPVFTDFQYYLIGTRKFVKELSTTLTTLNVGKEDIKVDDFG
ncbi:FAD-dependent oxidoreductase [Flammeovirga kamogawensis]|uniref:FAD-dependent oxidoreductase n=1 Tax=Flammeovirga kamogawensis TaxID=373891 RepID=A0ABX8GZ93_9BACT|nr:FAD-dependent oxidoreductase [Flammeovirga kamogawensis]MBB6459336.1 phytoene dehydrogenase-like protein/ferredoxin-NADP reductase [Flammeovirga kamogawensis]QWG08895.1 FAD-dependent oxidoreductase [Flammeovirga kamogawensis]